MIEIRIEYKPTIFNGLQKVAYNVSEIFDLRGIHTSLHTNLETNCGIRMNTFKIGKGEEVPPIEYVRYTTYVEFPIERYHNS